jgi:hypothetical protein
MVSDAGGKVKLIFICHIVYGVNSQQAERTALNAL